MKVMIVFSKTSALTVAELVVFALACVLFAITGVICYAYGADGYPILFFVGALLHFMSLSLYFMIKDKIKKNTLRNTKTADTDKPTSG